MPDEKVDYEKLISVDEIHRHRMQAEPEEILMPLLSEAPDTAKNRKRALSAIYHPDKYPGGDQLMHDLMNARMQEINAAQNAFDAIHRGNDSEPE